MRDGSSPPQKLYRYIVDRCDLGGVRPFLNEDELTSLEDDPVRAYSILNRAYPFTYINEQGKSSGTRSVEDYDPIEVCFYLLFDSVFDEDYIYPHPTNSREYRFLRNEGELMQDRYKKGGEPVSGIVVVTRGGGTKREERLLLVEKSSMRQQVSPPESVPVEMFPDEQSMILSFYRSIEPKHFMIGWKLGTELHVDHSLAYLEARLAKANETQLNCPTLDIFNMIRTNLLTLPKRQDTEMRVTEIGNFTFALAKLLSADTKRSDLEEINKLVAKNFCSTNKDMILCDLREYILRHGKVDWEAISYFANCPLHLYDMLQCRESALTFSEYSRVFLSEMSKGSLYTYVHTLLKSHYYENSIVYNMVLGDGDYTRFNEQVDLRAGSYVDGLGRYESNEKRQIVELDFESMYPAMIILNNIGPTSLRYSGMTPPSGVRSVSLQLAAHDSDPVTSIHVWFDPSAKNPLRSILLEGIKRRRELKEAVSKQDGTERSFSSSMEKTIKRMNASIYGVLGMKSSRMRLAMASVTRISQLVYDKTLALLKEVKAYPIYGKTDSFIVSINAKERIEEKVNYVLSKLSLYDYSREYLSMEGQYKLHLKIETYIDSILVKCRDHYVIHRNEKPLSDPKRKPSTILTKGFIIKKHPDIMRQAIHSLLSRTILQYSDPSKGMIYKNEIEQYKKKFNACNDFLHSEDHVENSPLRRLCSSSIKCKEDPRHSNEKTYLNQHIKRSIKDNRSYIPLRGDHIEYLDNVPSSLVILDDIHESANASSIHRPVDMISADYLEKLVAEIHDLNKKNVNLADMSIR